MKEIGRYCKLLHVFVKIGLMRQMAYRPHFFLMVAGKTTTSKMLSGILYPSSGHVEVLGSVPSRRRKSFEGIGYVAGQRNRLFWDLPAQDYFNFLKVPMRSLIRSMSSIRRLLRWLTLEHVKCSSAKTLFGRAKTVRWLGSSPRSEGHFSTADQWVRSRQCKKNGGVHQRRVKTATVQ
jgi:ABC-type lipopolysaccharide export system ATPase subunit